MLIFKLTQHSRDKELITSLIKYLECGNVYYDKDCIQYTVFKFEDLVNKVIPFFDKYNIIGVKKIIQTLKKVSELMKKKEHLTTEGLNEISEIRDNNNKRRDTY